MPIIFYENWARLGKQNNAILNPTAKRLFMLKDQSIISQKIHVGLVICKNLKKIVCFPSFNSGRQSITLSPRHNANYFASTCLNRLITTLGEDNIIL